MRRFLPFRSSSVGGLSNNSSSSSSRRKNDDNTDDDNIVRFPPSYPREVPGPMASVPSRKAQVERLKQSQSQSQQSYDLLVIGGGATGAGCALDASSRGLRVACIERGDFGGETSSRSTKLVWAGIKYLATAVSSLLSVENLTTRPMETWRSFTGELRMVRHCHRERRYMVERQPHLVRWLPIAVPFDRYFVWDEERGPPLGHPLYSLFPVLAPLVFKVYDALSGFRCPPSYVLGTEAVARHFPQLDASRLKYCAVFYEATHNDARTNLSIAMSAAAHGAHIANYVEMISVITDDNDNDNDSDDDDDDKKDKKDEYPRKVVGVRALDRATGETFEIRADRIVFAGGPFTDDLRRMESNSNNNNNNNNNNESNNKMVPAVSGAAGSHIVLPKYYCSSEMGLLDYNTSDGRFLFVVPWEGHTLVGTTDVKCPAETLPRAPEEEVQWLLKESSKYLDPSTVTVRRSDVSSAWRGWRPLAHDPHAPPGGPVSRDHVISENPDTGVVFVAGGKWTTWREMAEDVIDRIITAKPKTTATDTVTATATTTRSLEEYPCQTLDITLIGGENFTKALPIQLVQTYGIELSTAEHLSRTYGTQAHAVCQLLRSKKNTNTNTAGIPLVDGFPYLEAEVRYACREYAVTVEDVLSRRTRLAYLDREKALAAVPRVADLMAEELGWSHATKRQQAEAATRYIATYGGRTPYE